ncbi:hypothetical protein [Mesorhizobium sp. KR1-2]|uniref:hypothetical protein n=1 Tax=Mesorhizobium sp. KR1-2 TaxID=3156609 RepID=UPI0032B55CEA
MAEQVKILEVSDGLKMLRASFDFYVDGRATPTLAEFQVMQEACDSMYRIARMLENELSVYRWNEHARRDRDVEMARILDEATRPGSNVKLFPVFHRPILSDGPTGAA